MNLNERQLIALYVGGLQVHNKSKSIYYVKPERKDIRAIMEILNRNGLIASQGKNGTIEIQVPKHCKSFDGNIQDNAKRPYAPKDSLEKHLKTEIPIVKSLKEYLKPAYFVVSRNDREFCYDVWFWLEYSSPALKRFSFVELEQETEQSEQTSLDLFVKGEKIGRSYTGGLLEDLAPVIHLGKYTFLRGLRIIWNDGEMHTEWCNSSKEREEIAAQLEEMGLTPIIDRKNDIGSDDIENYVDGSGATSSHKWAADIQKTIDSEYIKARPKIAESMANLHLKTGNTTKSFMIALGKK